MVKAVQSGKTMPELMVQYRSATLFGRLFCPDLLMGMQSVDELRRHQSRIKTDNFTRIIKTGCKKPQQKEIEDDEILSSNSFSFFTNWMCRHINT